VIDKVLRILIIVCCALMIIFTVMALVAQYTHTAW
jgi:hypothetical protein